MIKLLEVSLANNGWVVTYPPDDEGHILHDSLYLDNKGCIEDILYDIKDALCIDSNKYIVTIKVKEIKKSSKKEIYWEDPKPIPMPPVKE